MRYTLLLALLMWATASAIPLGSIRAADVCIVPNAAVHGNLASTLPAGGEYFSAHFKVLQKLGIRMLQPPMTGPCTYVLYSSTAAEENYGATDVRTLLSLYKFEEISGVDVKVGRVWESRVTLGRVPEGTVLKAVIELSIRTAFINLLEDWLAAH